MVTQKALRMRAGYQVYSENNLNVRVSVVVLNKCDYQIKLPISRHKCATISELQSNISTMIGVYLIDIVVRDE